MRAFLIGFVSLVVLLSGPALAQTRPRCPNLLITFDVSGSMQQPAQRADGGTADRYVVGREAVGALLASNPDQLRFGLELFGDVTAGGSCGVSSATCFHPTASCNSVLADYGTADDIMAVLNALTDNTVNGSTPTWLAIDEATLRADMNDSLRPRYVILLTDGDPAGCSQTSSGALQQSIDAITSIRTNMDVKTFVLGFAGGAPDKLNQMAIAGGTARFDASQCNETDRKCFYDASNAQQLEQALNAIVNVVAGELGGISCDDTCYAQGCPAGELCSNAECVPDPCANVTCDSGSLCVMGACQKPCSETCLGNTRCEDGACVADQPCSESCDGRNQTCVNGQCVENYCSGQGPKLECPSTHICYRNGCHLKYAVPGADAGTSGDGGTSSDGTGQDVNAGGCCSGAPGAFNLLALGLGLTALRLFRRRNA